MSEKRKLSISVFIPSILILWAIVGILLYLDQGILAFFCSLLMFPLIYFADFKEKKKEKF